MDQRVWVLENELPNAAQLADLVSFVPKSGIRSTNVMKLYLQGFKTGFRLTDAKGQPTKTLDYLMELLQIDRQYWVQCHPAVVRYEDLPDNERKEFGKPRPDYKQEGMPVHGEAWHATPGHWYIRGFAERIRNTTTAGDNGNWIAGMLPDNHWRKVTYKENGKNRRRLAYLVKLKPNWMVTHGVYTGLYYWHNDFWKSWPNPYHILADLVKHEQGIGGAPAGDRGDGKGASSPEALVQAAPGPAA